MSLTFEQKIQNYAEVLVKIGLNIQPNQTLVIRDAPISSYEFIRIVTKTAYKEGAKHIYVDWKDDHLTRLMYDYAPVEAFLDFPNWKTDSLLQLAEKNAAFLSIYSANPDLLAGVDPVRISTYSRTAGKAMKPYFSITQSNKVSWCVASVPNKDWAAKLFPDAPQGRQENLLWEQIFDATLSSSENAIDLWKSHVKLLQERTSFLNNKKYKTLHYTGPGTNLSVGLSPVHLWAGGINKNAKGNNFVPNVPTEEVFTTPDKNRVNGYVTNTKPLIYGGNIIDQFTIWFENGKIIDYKAEIGFEFLRELIETDDGSHYLGEVALVPHDSPISNSNITFYNTLYDENASCHFAIGSAYPFCLENGVNMSRDELDHYGANDSITHEDFMIGSSELNITGETADGKKEEIFKNGNWVV